MSKKLGGKIHRGCAGAYTGYEAFDEAALKSAQASKYKNARSYCTNVPGLYLFKAAFGPN